MTKEIPLVVLDPARTFEVSTLKRHIVQLRAQFAELAPAVRSFARFIFVVVIKTAGFDINSLIVERGSGPVI